MIIAEIPAADDLVLFTEDERRFYYGEQAIDKDLIAAVRVLINGAPIAAYVSIRAASHARVQATHFEDRPEGIARDRWDVAIEAINGTTIVACGAIRERVSQELARAVFDAVKRDLERRDA
jgi:translation elongation factor EF-4